MTDTISNPIINNWSGEGKQNSYHSIYQPQAGQPSYINPSLYTGGPNSLGQYATSGTYKPAVYKPFSNTTNMLSNYFGTTTGGGGGGIGQGLGALGMGNTGYLQDIARGREGSVEQDKTDVRNENLSPVGMKGLAGLVSSMFGGPISFLLGNIKYAKGLGVEKLSGSDLASQETSGHRGATGAYSDTGYGTGFESGGLGNERDTGSETGIGGAESGRETGFGDVGKEW